MLTKTLFTVVLGGALAAQTTVTALVYSGPSSSKRDLVIVGDGFAANDQNRFNTVVQDRIRTLFQLDVFGEAGNAFNVWRVNTTSTDSGVTLVDSSGRVTASRRTALDFRYSGVWERCWMEFGPASAWRLFSLLSDHAPFADNVIVVLNHAGGGGCQTNGLVLVSGTTDTAGNPRGTDAWTYAHELGHLLGDLGDEYTRGSTATYTGGEPGRVNLTTERDRTRIKWRRFIPPARPLPTPLAAVSNHSQDVGLFEGGTTSAGNAYGAGIFRPVHNCRMNGNVPAFCPVCYEKMRAELAPYEDRAFRNIVAGDFDADGKADIVQHNASILRLYTSDNGSFRFRWQMTHSAFGAALKLSVADLDGDGRDDLIAYDPGRAMYLFRSNGSELVYSRGYGGSLSGWTMGANDELHVGDFNGDGRDDLVVVNTRDWATPKLGLWTTAAGISLVLQTRYDGWVPGFGYLYSGSQVRVGDFDGDGRSDLFVHGFDYMSVVNRLTMLRSLGSDFAAVQNYRTSVWGWTIAAGDQLHVGDFDGDGRSDLYLFNAVNWATPWLAMMRSTGSGLARAASFSGTLPGWGGMRRNDRFHVADVDGDRRDDLYVYNALDWGTEYLGTLRSTGTGLTGGFQAGGIGSWNLGRDDRLLVADTNGGGWDDLIVFNDNWLGLLGSYGTGVWNARIFPHYIHEVPYHEHGWW